MDKILIKLIHEKKVVIDVLYEALYEICDSIHSSCDSECPVYAIRENIGNGFEICNCLCFKNGKKMYDFIKKNG